MTPLLASQQLWVDQTLDSLSLDQCLGHLLCPEDRNYTEEEWRSIARDIPLGCVFMGGKRPAAELAARIAVIQEESAIPVLAAVDMVTGVGVQCSDRTLFPGNMAFGAAADETLCLEVGRAIAREARALGIGWTFSPVVDLQINPANPIVLTRSYGDDPARVAGLISARIHGLQDDGLMAATAKHFPGDGLDDRDQHLCTTINPLPMKKWRDTYGIVWQAALDAGVLAVMTGHISLPHYTGETEDPSAALPATLCPRLQQDLLRVELGFAGVIVSDAAPMIGLTSRGPADRLAIENIRTGGDSYLFADPRVDFARLKAAVERGELSEARVRASARRVLELKARIGLHEQLRSPEVDATALVQHRELARRVARKAITVLREDASLKNPPRPGAKILVVDIFYKGRDKPLQHVVDRLREKGFQVEHLTNPGHDALMDRAREFERVYVNVIVQPHSLMGTARLLGGCVMNLWRGFWVDAGNAVFTSFGSPYLLYELPHLPNLVLTYGTDPASQEAAVDLWVGDIQATGKCPVTLPSIRNIVKRGNF